MMRCDTCHRTGPTTPCPMCAIALCRECRPIHEASAHLPNAYHNGARWNVGPGGVWQHEIGHRAHADAVLENLYGYGFKAVIERAVDALEIEASGRARIGL